MSKHHIQNISEQLANKGHASSPFHQEMTRYLANEVIKSQENQSKAAENDSSIKLRAYQIHVEKGGSDIDNWLEAEQSLKNSDNAVAGLINEGYPNTEIL